MRHITRHLTTILALAIISLCASAADAPPGQNPPWLQAKIASYAALPPFMPPRSISSVQYQGKTAYYVSPACCDIPSELYDDKGEMICLPSGGFAGGDGRCPAGALASSAMTVVWRDTRDDAPTDKKPVVKR